MRKGLSIARQNSGAILAAIVLIFLASFLAPSFAASFTANEELKPTLIVSTIRTFNISVNNTNTTNNITMVAIVLPSGFRYIQNSNATSAINTNFSNQTNAVTGIIDNLTWGNNTLGLGIVPNGSAANFTFRVYLPSTTGTYNITVQTYLSTSEPNVTNVTLVITGLSSLTGNFSAYHEEVFFNWTNGTVTLEANLNNSLLMADNYSTNISSVYFSKTDWTESAFPNLGPGNRERCFDVSDGFAMEMYAENTSRGTFGFLNRSVLLNETDVISFTLRLSSPFCPPGLYKGMFAIRNLTNPNTNALHVPATVNVPISKNNTYLVTNNTAYVKGNNISQTVQSFYFFTNISQNITAVTINASFSRDVDLFLLDSTGTLLEKSIGTGVSSEEVFRFLPSPVDVWEIRVADALQSYTSYLYFSTLNFTNVSHAWNATRNLTFGPYPLDPNETNSTEFRITNDDLRSVPAVYEDKEVYNIQRFNNINISGRYDVFVPSYATKLKVRLEWKNETGRINQTFTATDWDLFLRDNTGRFIANSTNKSAIVNSTPFPREEFIVYTGPFNTTYEGLWNVTVMNLTSEVNKSYYNLSVLIYMNEILWINTSFNPPVTFNSSGDFNSKDPNSSFNVTANITVPRNNILNGTYEGFLTYHNNSGWKVKLPLYFQVTAGHFFVDKNVTSSTFNSQSGIGSNRTIFIFMNISFNNTGGAPIFFTNTTSGNLTSLSSALFLASDNSKLVNFTIDGPPPYPIMPGTRGTINITVTVNTTLTANAAGIYRGFIFFNSSNVTNFNSSSYPYQMFNLTLDLNLTDRLNATIVKIFSNYSEVNRIENTSVPSPLTMETIVYLSNGTRISSTADGDLKSGDFYSPSIIEFNTSTSYSLANLTDGDGASPLCDADSCNLNATVPGGVVGGRYKVILLVRWNATETNLTGTAFNSTLIVNNTGLNMTAPQSTTIGNLNELASTYFNVTVANFGPLDAIQTQITLNKGTCPVTVTRETSFPFSGGCSGLSSSGSSATISATINGYTPTSAGCALRWKIVGDNVSSDTSCTLNITADRASHNNITGITLTVKDTGGSSSSSTTTSGGSGGATSNTTGASCTSNSACAATERCSGGTCTALSCQSHEYISDHACVAYAPNIAEYQSNFSVLIGGSILTTVKINESNNKTISVALAVNLPAEIERNVTPATCYTPCVFTVNMTATATSEIKAYDGTFKASHSVFPAAFQEKTFTFTVLPTEEKKTEIRQKYQNLLPSLTQVQQQFLSLQGSLTEGNRTLLQTLIDRAGNLSADIQSALNAEDFVRANTLMGELNSTISQIHAKFSEITKGTTTDFTLWIIIGVVIAIVVFTVYLLLPPKKKQFGSSFPQPKKKGFFGPVAKSRPARIKRINQYSEAYQKVNPLPSKKKSGLTGLFKRPKKKKQRKLKDFRVKRARKQKKGGYVDMTSPEA